MEEATPKNVISGMVFGAPDDQDETRELREQFFTSLEGRLHALGAPVIDGVDVAATVAAAKALIDKRDSWASAYRAENLLTTIYHGDLLKTEVERRLDEVEDLKLPSADALRKTLNDGVDPVSKTWPESLGRAVLLRAVDDLQWRQKKKYLARRLGRQMASKVNIVFWCAVAAFFATGLVGWAVSDTSFAYVNYGLTVALSFGLIGASFSMLHSLRPRIATHDLDALRLNSSYRFILLRLLVGFGATLMLYYLFRSGLLGGELFPDLTKLGFETHEMRTLFALGENGDGQREVLLPTADNAKLVFWCFLGGFSERFFLGVLEKFESRSGEAV